MPMQVGRVVASVSSAVKIDASPSSSASELGIGRRVAVLKDVVRVLKTIESHVRSRSAEGGGVPTIDEQRMLFLILSHVDYCILLYHSFRLKKYSLPMSALSMEEEGSRKKRAKTKIDEVKKSALLPHSDLDRKLDSVGEGICYIMGALKICWNSLTGFDPASLAPCFVLQEYEAFDAAIVRAACAGQEGAPVLIRHLVDVLHSLEVLAEEGRGYAPPSDDEINSYREVRKSVSSLLAFLHAKTIIDYSLTKSLIETPLPVWPPGSFRGPIFLVHGHLLPASFELMHQYRSLFEEHKARLAHFLSVVRGNVVVVDDDQSVDIGSKIGRHQLIRWREQPPNDNESAEKKTRLEVLNIIISKLNKIASLTPKGELTDREFLLYAHIAEHVRAHLNLSEENAHIKRKSSCLVNISNVKELAPTMDGDTIYSREQYLEDIVSYLRAVKPLFTADVLTCEERRAYEGVWVLVGSEFLWCKCSIPVDPTAVKETDKKPISWLQDGLIAVKESISAFLAEVESEDVKLMVSFSEAVMPGKSKYASAGDAFESFMLSEEVANRLREIFQGDSPGGIELLEEFIVILREVEHLRCDLFMKLNFALDSLDQEWDKGKYLSLVEMELRGACDVMAIEH